MASNDNDYDEINEIDDAILLQAEDRFTYLPSLADIPSPYHSFSLTTALVLPLHPTVVLFSYPCISQKLCTG